MSKGANLCKSAGAVILLSGGSYSRVLPFTHCAPHRDGFARTFERLARNQDCAFIWREGQCHIITKGQAAIVALVRAMRDGIGNLPPMPGIFPDFLAPIARNAPDGVREFAMARWGMPGPPAFGGAPITNIRNVKSPHWRA
jgi:hypothetical protein